MRLIRNECCVISDIFMLFMLYVVVDSRRLLSFVVCGFIGHVYLSQKGVATRNAELTRVRRSSVKYIPRLLLTTLSIDL